jgi:SAM-dependent methyltransferase
MTTSQPLSSPTDLPPQVLLYQIATGYYVSRALYVAATLGVADLLTDGPRPCGDLAQRTGTHAPSLRRVLRLLVSAGVFAEQEDGRFALTPIGECLRSDLPGSFRSTALLFTGPLEWAAWGDLPHTVLTGEPALEHVFGMNSFEYLAQHPDEAASFDDAMAAFTRLVALAAAAAYDFSQFGTIVDVGGGNGALMIGILNANPTLRGIVFDLPRVGERAKLQIAAAGLNGRCEFVGGDFFVDALPAGRDAYMLKHVIHDWDDARATAILKNCHRAVGPQGKLLIVEGVYPPRVDQSAASRAAAANDVNMLVCTGGRQRSEAEFRSLFDAAGFQLARITPTLAASSVIEATRV